MDEIYTLINKVPTHLMIYGKDDLASAREVIVLISGNPGLPGFYTSFCSTLYNEFEKEIPIVIIGHAGHDEPNVKNISAAVPPLEGNHDLYNLRGQINHKIDFLTNHIPKEAKIHLVSHSIGSKISLELLKDEKISEKILQCYLLFPTIERMLESSNGFWFYKVFNPIHFILRFFYYAFSYLPLIVRTWLLYFYCYLAGFPEFFLGTVIKTSSPTALDKIWFMAKDEMEKVCEIDEEIIKKNLHRLKFYYGTTDGWVPVDYYKELLRKFPGIDAELCQRSIDHSFVISHGPTMGRMVSDWVRRKRVK